MVIMLDDLRSALLEGLWNDRLRFVPSARANVRRLI